MSGERENVGRPKGVSTELKGGLSRLDDSFYRGNAWVHWSMAIDQREVGWLMHLTHLQIREALLHTCVRYKLACPVYCLMPDHGHFLLGGLHPESDQLKAVKFFRQEWNRLLKLPRNYETGRPKGVSTRLQHQAYDHVLRKDELEAFPNVAGYILENPVRAQLVGHFSEWEFLGTILPSYPRIHPTDSDFWDRYWKMHYQLQDQLTKS